MACQSPLDFLRLGRQGWGKHRAFGRPQAGLVPGTALSWLGDRGQAASPP